MKKYLLIASLFISALAFGQHKITISAGGIGGGSGIAAPLVTVSSSTSLTLTVTGSYLKTYAYTSSSNGTWTMPAIGTTGQRIKIKNKGTGDLTIQRAGSNQLFTDALVNSIILYTGETITLQDDGTNWSTFEN